MKDAIQFALGGFTNFPSKSVDFLLVSEIAGQNGSVFDDFLKFGLSLLVADGINDPGAFLFERFGDGPSDALLVGETNDQKRFCPKARESSFALFFLVLDQGKSERNRQAYLAFVFDLAGHVEKFPHPVSK